MAGQNNKTVAVVVPNWNGEKYLGECLHSLQSQVTPPHIIVVDNGSIDKSVRLIETQFPTVELIKLSKNYGFAGGVNAGVRKAIADGYTFIALLNNDAVADRQWISCLLKEITKDDRFGIATAKIVDFAGNTFDSTGEFYTTWGLPFARGRGDPVGPQYDNYQEIFAASGGASIFRTKMLKEIGLFDEDFFAYYEDVDLSFRAQLRGWKVRFAPDALVHHRIGATSAKIKGFTTYQTLKNLPLLCYKNVPRQLLPVVLPRLLLAYVSFIVSALSRRQGGAALKGVLVDLILTPKKLMERYSIQSHSTVSTAEIREMIVPTLPPGANRLQRLVHPIKYRQNRNIDI